MAFELFKVLGSIVIDDADALKTLKQTDTEAKNNAKSLGEVEGKLSGLGKKIITAFSVVAITSFTKSVIETTAQLDAMDAQFDQVFGADTQDAMSRIEQQSKDMKIHQDRLTNSWNQFGAQVKGAGMDAQESLEATDLATRLAADGAAFFDTSLKDTTNSLSSLMKGNFSAGDAIGVFTNATQMGKEAQDKFGLSWNQLNEAQKQSLILAKVEETYKLNGAMGQAVRESENWENVSGNLSATWDRLIATVGQPVLSVATTIVQGLTDTIGWLTENLNIVIPVVAGLTAAFVAQMIVSTVSQLMSAYQAVTEGVTFAQWLLNAAMSANPFGAIAVLIGVLIAAGVALWANWESVTNFLGDAWKKMEEVFKNTTSGIASWASSTFESIKRAIMNPIETAKNFVGDMIENIKGFFNFSWEFPKLKMPHFTATGSWNPIDWLTQGVPQIGVEWYAKGGIMNSPTVFGMNGNNMMVGGEKDSEAVLPLNAQNLGAIGKGVVEASSLGDTGLLNTIINQLNTLIAAVNELILRGSKYQMILDTGVLVGELTNPIDESMGQGQKDKERGRR